MIPETLQRYPVRKNDPLRAWDAADALLLQHLREQMPDNPRTLILNDTFGALCCGLDPALNKTVYTDSYVSARAIQSNSQGQLEAVSELASLTGPFDLAILRFPKNLSFLEDQLCRLSQVLVPGAPVIGASMVKHLSPGVFPLLQKYIGETHTSLAEKKARLVFASLEHAPTESPYPLTVPMEGFSLPFVNHANLFSRGKLDTGTKLLLAHVPEHVTGTILDLGCGDGILGVAAKQKSPEATLVFADVSQMALLSARANWQAYFPDQEASFVWTNGYENQERESLEFVLCNPPYHQEKIVTDSVAWQMFVDARRALRPGGTLRIVGNSHLGYHLKLKHIFGNSKIVARNESFLIIDAVK